jgi:hypothetical protein
VRNHHAKGFLDPQVKGAVHALSDVPAQGAETTRLELPACASPSSIPWHASRAEVCSSSSFC